MSEARTQIFAALRAAAEPRPPKEPVGPNPGRPAEPEDLVATFCAQLEVLGVLVHRAADEREAAAHVARIAGSLDVARSDADLVRRVTEDLSAFDGWSDRERLVEAGLGVSAVQAAVAETGTLVLGSSDERHRLVSLVPPVHVALVRRQDLVPDLDSALEQAGAGGLPAVVSFITGPSRTADIELTLVVGVHGPRELHVVLLP